MAIVTDRELSKYKDELDSANQEKVQLFVPKDVASKFRQMAKASQMTTAALFTEMVEAHALGMSLELKSE